MRILQICFRMPFPLKDGGAIAMHNLTKAFHDLGCHMTLLVPITAKHDIELDELPEDFKGLAEIHTVKINSDISVWGAFKNLFTSKPYYISRYENKAFETKLIEILKNKKFDIILIESLKVSMYTRLIRQFSDAKIVMRSHNIEYKIWERHAKSTKAGPKKWYLNLLVKRLRKYEIGTLNDFDMIVPITAVDGDFFKSAGCIKPVFPTASGIDFSKFTAKTDLAEARTLFHLGALDWMPNQEAVNWFIKQIWPLIHKKYPDYKFYLAGRNMPQSFLDLNIKGIEVVGEVEHAIDFINSKQIMIVPLLSGSGMRIKIVEGMALGKIIISTSIGAEGIDYTDGINILIANSPKDYVAAIEKIVNDEAYANQISDNAIKLAREKYDNTSIVKDLLLQFETLEKHS